MNSGPIQTNLLQRQLPWWQEAKNNVALFLIAWFIVGLVQISVTSLTSDEGYYWFYAQHLQWGYYDHPPAVALLIKLGAMLLPAEAGVRLFNLLMSTGSLWLFFKLLPADVKTKWPTYLIVLSAPLVHYLSFIVFPDGPLLFFSLLFLVVYKKYIVQPTMALSVVLGMAAAGMAWSKYHGALVILFTVLANPRLLRQRHFYLAMAVALLLFAPHLWWQYSQGFPTIKYHLQGRTGSYSFRHVGEYLSQQLIAIGPGLIFIPFVVKARDVFERTLRFIIIGTFSFFLLSSAKTFVHFHWTSIAVFPLLYFAVRYYGQPNKRRLLNRWILPFVVLFFIGRLLLMVPVIPAMHAGEDYYHGREAWAKEIAAAAAGRPVLMPNNLREASLYSFYSGQMGVTLYNRPEKKSQYELWGYEDSLQGKEVLFVTKYPFNGSRPLTNNLNQSLHYDVLPGFHSYYGGITLNSSIYKRTADSLFVTIGITNGRKASLRFAPLNNETVTLVASVEMNKRVIKADAVKELSTNETIAPGAMKSYAVSVAIKDLPAGEYTIYFGIRAGVLPDAVVSNAQVITVR